MATANIYVVWYGNWAANTATTIIPTFLTNVAGSNWFGTNIGYYGTNGAYLSRSVTYAGSCTDSYSRGSNLTQTDVANIVYGAIVAGKLPNDPTNGLYFVLSSKDVKGKVSYGMQELTPF
jgi:hypothetical protein